MPELAEQVLAGHEAEIANHLEGHLIADCGHIVPVDRPEALVELLRDGA